MDDKSNLQNLPGYLSTREAAEILGLSPRRLNEYVKDGKLKGFKVGRSTLLREEDVETFRRSRIGRPRTTIPIWHQPVGENLQYLTIIFARIRPGQREALDRKLDEMRMGKKHLLPGTVARYIALNEDKPSDVQIVLVWRSSVMPPEEERQATIAAFRAELADILDWDTSWSERGRVLIHA